MHHLNIKKTRRGTVYTQRKDHKPLNPLDRIEAKYMAAADEPMEVGSENGPSPYIDPDGNLIIPFSSPPRYHWWRGGQSVLTTLLELGASKEVLRKYKDKED